MRDADDDADGDARALRAQLERTSARALRALEEKDATIERLRRTIAKYERDDDTDAHKGERGERGEYENQREREHGTGAKQKALERALDDERGRAIELRRQLREATLHASKLEESHDAAKKFALEGARHAEALRAFVKSLASERENRARERDAAASENQKKLIARMNDLEVHSRRLEDEKESWQSKARALEEALAEIKSFVFAEDGDFNRSRADDTAVRVKLVETQLALREALDENASSRVQIEARERFSSDGIERVNTSAAREDARVAAINDKVATLERALKEQKSNNRSQVTEIERLETSLREQISSNKVTLETAEISANAASRENARLMSSLRAREADLVALRDTVAILEGERAPPGEEWRQIELNKSRDRAYALEMDNARLESDCEILTGETLRLRQELKNETERADAHETIGRAAKRREELIAAQLELKGEECSAYMETELALLRRVEEIERSRFEIENQLKAREELLASLSKRSNDATHQNLEAFKRSIQQSVNESPLHVAISADFCRRIRARLRDHSYRDDSEAFEDAIEDAQRTIVRLECDAIRYECAFNMAMRHVARTEHRSMSTRTAFDHVCAVLALSQTSYASLASTAFASLEARLVATKSRNDRLNEMLSRDGGDGAMEIHEIEERLFEKDEKMRWMAARIEELEATGHELIGAREAAARAMQSMSVARDAAKKELFDEQDRSRMARDTISELKTELSRVRVDSDSSDLGKTTEIEALNRAHAAREAEMRMQMEREWSDASERYNAVCSQLAQEREQLRIAHDKLNQVFGGNQEAEYPDPSYVGKLIQRCSDLEKAIENERDAKRSTEFRDANVDIVVSDGIAEQAIRIDDFFASQSVALEGLSQRLERDTMTSVQAYADVLTARLLNFEVEIGEQKRRQEEWQSSSTPSDAERRSHLERCQRYRDMMHRMRAEHERERERMRAAVHDAEAKIAELTRRVESTRNGSENMSSFENQVDSPTSDNKLESPATNARDSQSMIDEMSRELDLCKAHAHDVEEATTKRVEKQLTQRFRRDLTRYEDDVEGLREWVAAYASASASLVDAVRALAARLLRLSFAVSRGEKTQETIIAASVDLTDASSSADVAAALTLANYSPESLKAAISWCETRAAKLLDALASRATSCGWHSNDLADVVSLVEEQAGAAEMKLCA